MNDRLAAVLIGTPRDEHGRVKVRPKRVAERPLSPFETFAAMWTRHGLAERHIKALWDSLKAAEAAVDKLAKVKRRG